jgi:Lrp/AsnC family transcriptional regulator, leucine-responsive regulatory protein
MKRAKIRSKAKASAVRRRGPLDVFDRRILQALTANARATNVEIAQRVGLSEAPCSRRIHRLEEEGVIRGYGVRIDPAAVGVGITAFITLTLDVVSAQSADRFAEVVKESPHVLACYIVSGSAYALLHVAAPDIQAYSEFVLDRLRTIPGVKDLNSNFVMRVVKESGGLPDMLEGGPAGPMEESP